MLTLCARREPLRPISSGLMLAAQAYRLSFLDSQEESVSSPEDWVGNDAGLVGAVREPPLQACLLYM